MTLKSVAIWLTAGVLAVSILFGPVAAQQPQSSPNEMTARYWDELMHYALIGRWDLARENGQNLIGLNPDPIELLDLAESERYADSYRNLALLQADSPIKEIADEILKRIEQGRFLRRTDAQRIAVEIERLSGTTRGRMMAINRLKDSGEWAVPLMIETLRDPAKTSQQAMIRWALPQLGQSAVNPLVVVLQHCQDIHIKMIVLDALGNIAYESALPYIREIVESSQSSTELITEAKTTLRKISTTEADALTAAALLFQRLAENYYNHLPSLAVPADQDLGNVWFWEDSKGLYFEQVPREAFDELMTMRCCEHSLKNNPDIPQAIALWISAFFRLEAEGHPQPAYFGPDHADADTYALVAGSQYLQRSLDRAMKNRNQPVALAAIRALKRNAGQQSLLYQVDHTRPLIEALSFPDRQVSFSAALAIAAALPAESFEHSEQVVPILGQALRQKGRRYALVVDSDQDRILRLSAELRAQDGFAEVVGEQGFTLARQRTADWPSVDLMILGADIKGPDVKIALDIIKKDYRLAFCPILILADDLSASTKELEKVHDFVQVALADTPVADLVSLAAQVLERNHAKMFDQTLADSYATEAVEVLRQLALTGNNVLPVIPAEAPLIEAVRDERKTIQLATIETLARVNSTTAQRTVATLALDESIDLATRLVAFRALSVSARAYGNLLLAEQIDAVYSLVRSREVDADLRNFAAQAHGSLNLPSSQISPLILEQMPQ